jgi:CDP-glycerol glycerophosphotransferase
LTRTTEEVAAALQDVTALEKAYADDLHAFNQRFHHAQDGHAAERVVEAFFGADEEGRPPF